MRAHLSNARICLPTWRGFNRKAFRCALYEAEDVLGEIDSVDFLPLKPAGAFRRREKLLKRLIWHDFTGRAVFANPGLETVRLEREYDLFLLVCQDWRDLFYGNAVKDWKERCRTSVCWIDEMWAGWVPRYRPWLHVLDQFDHVVLGLKGTVGALSDALDRSCHWVPAGVDVLRFAPYPEFSPRVLDILSFGRRWEAVHQALLDLSRSGEVYYVFDTFMGSEADPFDLREHRELLAAHAKRSRFFMVSPAKMDDSQHTLGQEEVGYRYFEGCAAGAVLIGQQPRSESFRTLFDWPDAVVEIRADGSDVAQVIDELGRNADRWRGISRRNVREAALRHDWLYRWKRILEIAGLEPAPGFCTREAELREVAGWASSDPAQSS